MSFEKRYFETVSAIVFNNKTAREAMKTLETANRPSIVPCPAAVFIMPHSNEGFGMTCSETIAFALPLVGSSVYTVNEFVIPEQNDFLIEPDDFTSLNACINYLHYNRLHLLKISLVAFQTNNERPKWNNNMGSIHRF